MMVRLTLACLQLNSYLCDPERYFSVRKAMEPATCILATWVLGSTSEKRLIQGRFFVLSKAIAKANIVESWKWKTNRDCWPFLVRLSGIGVSTVALPFQQAQREHTI